MGNKAADPVDHARTTRKHAGQNIKNTAAMPGILAIGLAVPALFIGLYALATAQAVVVVAVSLAIAAILAGVGMAWLAHQRKRVRRVEAQFVRDHPEADAQTPAS